MQGQCITSKSLKGGENGRRVAQHRDSGLRGISYSDVVGVFVVVPRLFWRGLTAFRMLVGRGPECSVPFLLGGAVPRI